MIDLTGQRFGRWTVLSKAERRTQRYWICRCDCGNTRKIAQNTLRSGQSRSCGCLRTRLTHGHAVGHRTTPEYHAWIAMRQSCSNPSCTAYPRYGGRGVRVCERWQESFANFLADVGKRPSADHVFSRRDKKGHFEPTNVHWILRSTRSRSRRNNRILEYNGQKRSVAEWAEMKGIHPRTVGSRLDRGWTIEQALETPVKSRSS